MGALSTADPDKGQSYSYTLLDGAGGRFKIQGNRVKVKWYFSTQSNHTKIKRDGT